MTYDPQERERMDAELDARGYTSSEVVRAGMPATEWTKGDHTVAFPVPGDTSAVVVRGRGDGGATIARAVDGDHAWLVEVLP